MNPKALLISLSLYSLPVLAAAGGHSDNAAFDKKSNALGAELTGGAKSATSEATKNGKAATAPKTTTKKAAKK